MNNIDKIKHIRDKTKMPLKDCKKELINFSGDADKAIEKLRLYGGSSQSRDDKEANEGYLGVYHHHDGKTVAVADLRCESDFVARSYEFREVASELAKQVAAMSPEYVSRNEMDTESILISLTDEESRSGKDEKIVKKIAEGRLNKLCSERCLIEQKWIKDPTKTVSSLINELASQVKENIKVNSFVKITI